MAFNFRVRRPTEEIDFEMLFSDDFDPVECRVFGTRTISCGLEPKLPVCEGCELAPGYVKTDSPANPRN